MKKFWVTVGVLALFLVSAVLHERGNLNAEPESLDYEKIAQDAERNRELLEIWKDHVKTLTKERDQATQELECMKASRVGAPMAQFGAIESTPLPQTPPAGGASRELQMQFSALQNQFQQLKQELAQARDDKERALQEKEKALSQIEKRAGASDAPAPAPAPPDRNVEIFMKRAYELQQENDNLKARIEKLKAAEKELADAKVYFAAENTSLAAEVERAHGEANQSFQNAQSMREENQKLIADIQTLRKEQEELAARMQTYKAGLQMAAADKEKFLELQAANTGYEQTLAAKDAELRRLNLQVETLEKTTRQIESRGTDNLRNVERYQAALRANLTDMKNLKSNFEAYLESLVASFEERQK